MAKWQLAFYADTKDGKRNVLFKFLLPYTGPDRQRALKLAEGRLNGYFKPAGFIIRKWFLNQKD